MIDLDSYPDGVYIAKLYKDSQASRVEKIDGVWYHSDGTGWKEKMEYPEQIISLESMEGKPLIKKVDLGPVTYPLSNYF